MAALSAMWSSKSLAKKLATVEELRAEMTSENIECPGILVVGAQSAGKSSVLERLTGITFPRAENTCTRVPTIVQLQTNSLVKTSTGLVSRDANFRKCRECSSLEDIQKAILDETEETVADGIPIKDEPIHIRYTRPSGPVMTLIDLPGITHVDAMNNGFDIHKVTSEMVEKYVNNDKMIIFVVIPANDDFGNSEALRIAQKYDKKGLRTIGVVSKCDLVPAKSDIIHKIRMMREQDVKLELGFIAVRNKGPGEEDFDIQASEDELFETHPQLKHLKPYERGYEALSLKVVELQSMQVDLFIPEARLTVRKKIKEIREELKEIGSHPSSSAERRNFYSKEIVDAHAFITRVISGAESNSQATNVCARCYDLSQAFSKRIREKIPDFLDGQMHETLKIASKEKMGQTLPNFISYSVFWDTIKKVFFRNPGRDDSRPMSESLDGIIWESTERFIDEVHNLMSGIFEEFFCKRQCTFQFPKLKAALLEQASLLLSKAQASATTVATAVITAERNQAFTQNLAYMESIIQSNEVISSLKANQKIEQHIAMVTNKGEINTENQKVLLKNLEKHATGNSEKVLPEEFIETYCNDEEMDENDVIMQLQFSLHSYKNILVSRLFDIIPMVVLSDLIHNLQKSFQKEMHSAFTDEILEQLFSENIEIRKKRENLEWRLNRMQEAEKKLIMLL